jgi:hypothetical protein
MTIPGLVALVALSAVAPAQEKTQPESPRLAHQIGTDFKTVFTTKENLATHGVGTVDSSGRGRGPWRCAPFDIDTGGYVDESVVAEGTWQMEPS